MAELDPALRKRVLRKVLNGVYVMTSEHEGRFSAALVTFVTQVSIEPPLFVVGVRKDSGLYEILQRSNRAAVHPLAKSQQDLATAFFKATRVEDGKLNGVPFRMEAGLPVLEPLPWYFFLETEAWQAGGDHAVWITRVTGVGANNVSEAEEEPLCMRDTPWSYGG
ncbi:flavin reductase family protein [Oceanithermus sp.]